MNTTIGPVETVNALERRISLALSSTEIAQEVDQRLKRLSQKVKLPGFRAGKVPLKMVAQAHGYQVESEVISDALNKALIEAIKKNNLRIAGQPRIERKNSENSPPELAFEAIFEIYPEIKVGDIAGLGIEKLVTTIGENELEKTIEVLRKQYVTYENTDRAAQDEDRLTIDFVGKLNGETFAGGSAQDYVFVLGQNQMLPDFEAGLRGMKVGQTKSVEVKFPENYHGAELAGKTAVFELTLKKTEAPQLPEVNEKFVQQLGVAEGNIEKFRLGVKENLDREVKNRLNQRNKQTVFDALLTIVEFEVPKSLVQQEINHMTEKAREEFKARGINQDMPIPSEVFQAQAEKRVRLGLMVAEIVKQQKLEAKPDQVKALIEEQARSYDQPDQVLRWYYNEPSRLEEVRAVVLEENLMNWALEQAKVTEKTIDFNELMHH